jgi:hypothetical protein
MICMQHVMGSCHVCVWVWQGLGLQPVVKGVLAVQQLHPAGSSKQQQRLQQLSACPLTSGMLAWWSKGVGQS